MQKGLYAHSPGCTLKDVPLFTQSNKRKYATEAMVHILNFIAHWPLSVRELLKKNCSVSLNGKAGHNIALDEWVEMCIVQPMKNYSTGAVYSLITEILAIVPDEAKNVRHFS